MNLRRPPKKKEDDTMFSGGKIRETGPLSMLDALQKSHFHSITTKRSKNVYILIREDDDLHTSGSEEKGGHPLPPYLTFIMYLFSSFFLHSESGFCFGFFLPTPFYADPCIFFFSSSFHRSKIFI